MLNIPLIRPYFLGGSVALGAGYLYVPMITGPGPHGFFD